MKRRLAAALLALACGCDEPGLKPGSKVVVYAEGADVVYGWGTDGSKETAVAAPLVGTDGVWAGRATTPAGESGEWDKVMFVGSDGKRYLLTLPHGNLRPAP